MIVNKQDVRDRSGSLSAPEEAPDAEEDKKETYDQQPEKQEKPAEPEKRKSRKEVKEAEKIKEAEKQAEGDEVSQKAAPPPSKMMTDDDLVADLKHVMSLDKPKQVKVLVYLAFKKGVHHAFNIAKKLKDPYLLDEFHDTMVDELYDLLIKKKKIKANKK
ncbi:MAG: hypothetical protein HQ530_01290 [Parcubacteria group bacterium]|nr:hypothetical protein [Parcubacteria group bacterium]